jgi:hypothetical protein
VVRVGVTGHRSLDDIDAVIDAVDGVLDRVADGPIEVRSSLAEGADRIVVERALRRPGSRLVAILPLDVEDYADDFGESVGEFDELLAGAAEVEVVAPATTREAAYEAAGRAVVDGSDVLVALWDGERSRGQGGTAEVVEYARARGVAVEVVPVRRRGMQP